MTNMVFILLNARLYIFILHLACSAQNNMHLKNLTTNYNGTVYDIKSVNHCFVFLKGWYKESVTVSINISCSESLVINILSASYIRPGSRGDSDCNSGNIKCCDNEIDDWRARYAVCNVPIKVKFPDTFEQLRSNCSFVNNCSFTFSALSIQTLCAQNCKDNNKTNQICWSRRVQINYICQDAQNEDNGVTSTEPSSSGVLSTERMTTDEIIQSASVGENMSQGYVAGLCLGMLALGIIIGLVALLLIQTYRSQAKKKSKHDITCNDNNMEQISNHYHSHENTGMEPEEGDAYLNHTVIPNKPKPQAVVTKPHKNQPIPSAQPKDENKYLSIRADSERNPDKSKHAAQDKGGEINEGQTKNNLDVNDDENYYYSNEEVVPKTEKQMSDNVERNTYYLSGDVTLAGESSLEENNYYSGEDVTPGADRSMKIDLEENDYYVSSDADNRKPGSNDQTYVYTYGHFETEGRKRQQNK